MSETIAPAPGREASPQTVARWFSVLTVLIVVGGVYALLFVSERLIVWRDASATAANILANRNLYLSAVAAFVVEQALSIATTALLYVLLKPAGRNLALIGLCLGLVANAVKTVGRVLFAAPLYLLGTSRFDALSPEVVNDLCLLLLVVNDHAAGIAMALFGFASLISGWLILRSTFLPRSLGVLSILGGLAWSTHAWPPLGYRLGDIGLLVGLVAVIAQVFWLAVFGVNEPRWHEQARGRER